MERRSSLLIAGCLALAALTAAEEPSGSQPDPTGPADGPAPPASGSASAATPVPAAAPPSIDVVFVLDTTGSMGGLIEGAKQKIWSIANTMASGSPAPRIRIGLLAYRDRGDDYVTRQTPLTDDLDMVYAQLMRFAAAGGGDTPESVNQALHEAVTGFEWSVEPSTLKIVYLVGDAPPHLDYPQDIHYLDTCRRAAESDILINTIQCGGLAQTTPIWQEIARRAEGQFAAIAQSGGVAAVATPFDAELATLGEELRATVVGYGSAEEQVKHWEKNEIAKEIEACAPAEAKADRACYAASDAGLVTLAGSKDLVVDVQSGSVKVEDLKKEDLPEALQPLSAVELKNLVAESAEKRQAIQQKIQTLDGRRRAFIDEQRRVQPGRDSFDSTVVDCLRAQAAKKGIDIAAPDRDRSGGTPKQETPAKDGSGS